jgi:hypothetical protein
VFITLTGNLFGNCHISNTIRYVTVGLPYLREAMNSHVVILEQCHIARTHCTADI